MDLEKFLKNMEKNNDGDAQENEGSKEYVKAWYIKEDGEYKIRIVPNIEDANELPFHKSFVHFGFQHPDFKDENGNPRNWVFECIGSGCPLCAHAKSFPQGSDEHIRYKAKVRFNYYILDPNENLAKFSISYAAHQTIYNAIVEQARSGVNTLSIKEGRYLFFAKETAPDKVVWRASFSDEEAPLSVGTQNELKDLKPLKELGYQLTEEELKNIVAGKSISAGKAKQEEKKIQSEKEDSLDLSVPVDDDAEDDGFDFNQIDLNIDDTDDI